MADWVSVVEAAYRLGGDEPTWLRELLTAATPIMPKHASTYAFTYDASNPRAFRMDSVITPTFPPKTKAADVIGMFSGMSGPEVMQSFGTIPSATASQVFGDGWETKVRMTHFEPFGIHDTFGVNALDPTGRGAGLGALLTKVTTLDAQTLASWTRVAAHIAAARRLRRAIGPLGSNPTKKAPVEGVVAPTGKLEYAANVDVERARTRLASAAVAMERARKRSRKKPNADALDEWHAMVFARWSLVEHFERDGKRYLVAVRNEAAPPMLAADLTSRESQVVGFALLGHTSKVTAYELGVSANTVRVLLARALRKLGVRSVRELRRRAPP